VKATLYPFWQAANPNPKATCFLPVPDGPSARQFSRLSIHSQRISSKTSALFSDGWAAKSNVSKLLACGKRASRIRRSTVTALAIDALEFAQAQQKARIIGAVHLADRLGDRMQGAAAAGAGPVLQIEAEVLALEMVRQA
jgi:hypothetical protein